MRLTSRRKALDGWLKAVMRRNFRKETARLFERIAGEQGWWNAGAIPTPTEIAMPRKKPRKKRTPDHQFLIFEIKAWEPSYSFSVNRSGDDESDFSEYAELHLDTVCVYPDPFVGRTAKMIASSRRGLFNPPNPRRDPNEKPNNVGLLDLPPSGGSFYTGVPNDSLPFIMAAIAGGHFRYLMLSGPSLKRSHSLPTQIHFARTDD